jgi:hypothetical protein
MNQTDGSTYVLINDFKKQPPQPADSKQQQRRLWDLQELFQAAARGKWGRAQWIAASDSGEDVAAWRRLATWPAEEEGECLRFNKAGDALYVFGTRSNR